MIDMKPRRSLPRADWTHAHRVVRIRAKLGRVPYRAANMLAMDYASTIVRLSTIPEIFQHKDDPNYVARARAAIA